MRLRWLGITGLVLVIAAVVLQLIGPRLWPVAYYGNNAYGWGMMPGMMGNGGMMGRGPGGMMPGGMMGGTLQDDPTQPFDLRFLDQMILHHAQGVVMTQHMAENSARPELRDLAERIITAQQREIEQMRAWRSEWYPEAPDLGRVPFGPGMMNGGQMGRMMGGQGQVDLMFLQMMIPHHEDAISMARLALEQAEHAELRALAENIIETQQAEIEEMQGYIADWYGR